MIKVNIEKVKDRRDVSSGLDFPWVLHPMGAGSVYFCTRDPNPTYAESGLGAGFIFHPWVHPKPERNPKPEKNLKKLKTREKPDPPPPKSIYKTQPASEPDPKSDGFRCQISPTSLDSGVKFNTTTFFYRSSFRSIQSKPDRCHP
jgi:hypothetical protein